MLLERKYAERYISSAWGICHTEEYPWDKLIRPFPISLNTAVFQPIVNTEVRYSPNDIRDANYIQDDIFMDLLLS